MTCVDIVEQDCCGRSSTSLLMWSSCVVGTPSPGGGLGAGATVRVAVMLGEGSGANPHFAFVPAGAWHTTLCNTCTKTLVGTYQTSRR